MEDVTKPAHYNQGSVECIDAMISAFGAEQVSSFWVRCVGQVHVARRPGRCDASREILEECLDAYPDFLIGHAA
eukprot:COSAG01_NODE_10389_length_2179_cov_1.138462_4_plen_73_part_01